MGISDEIEASHSGMYGVGDKADLPTPQEAEAMQSRLSLAEEQLEKISEAYLREASNVASLWRIISEKQKSRKDLSVRYSIDCADSIEWIKEFEDGTVDIVLSDVAYESLEKHRKMGSTTRLKKEWFEIFPNERLPEFFAELYRVMKKNSHLYFFCDSETMFEAKPIAEKAGFKFWKPLVWDYKSIGMGYHYRSQVQFVLFFEKGKRKLADLAQPDLIEIVRKSYDKRTHHLVDLMSIKKASNLKGAYPTEKPWEIARILCETTGVDADTVVMDPSCGSGAFGEGALRAGALFVGCDLSPKAVQISNERCARVVAEMG